MKIVAIVQARMDSTRLPKKVMKPICGTPSIGLLLSRLNRANLVDHVVLATTDTEADVALINYVQAFGCAVFQGDESDVLDRYYQAAIAASADVIVRITGDCPLIDPEVVDAVIQTFLQTNADYASNVEPATFPDGLDTEVFSFQALETAWKEAQSMYAREHVTPFMRMAGDLHRVNIEHETDCSMERWTLDESDDLDVIKKIYEYFEPRYDFGWLEVMDLRHKHPEFFTANQHLVRNEGATMGTGQKLWKRAKRVIPGGNMLLSKRAEMFLPDLWPAYFSKAKGCKVWDMDGHEYTDMLIMGIGTNTLGYGHPEVDDAVRHTIDSGNMATLNCPEEVYLAEKLIEMHPWADMARFARSGGEANAISIRIARAASGRDKVAICGYHGWHDWYLASNLADDNNLDAHLLPGLEPKGVPEQLCGTVLPFSYNNFPQLEDLVRQHEVGVIKMEVQRNTPPKNGFLEKVRKLATDNNIVLIFDECTSGFRQSFGGLHKVYGVEPDMAVFGKALGNGYAITAVIGRREVMEVAQSTFISSTFWTERIGSVAALKTLEVMERIKSYEQISRTGNAIADGWRNLAEKSGIDINISGIPSMIGFDFPSADMLAYKTLITQEMLTKGYLAATSVYVCTEHSDEIIEAYMDTLAPIFGLIAECENGRDIYSLLTGPVCHAGFKRLN